MLSDFQHFNKSCSSDVERSQCCRLSTVPARTGGLHLAPKMEGGTIGTAAFPRMQVVCPAENHEKHLFSGFVP